MTYSPDPTAPAPAKSGAATPGQMKTAVRIVILTAGGALIGYLIGTGKITPEQVAACAASSPDNMAACLAHLPAQIAPLVSLPSITSGIAVIATAVWGCSRVPRQI